MVQQPQVAWQPECLTAGLTVRGLPSRTISLARAFHSWAALTQSSRLQEPAQYSDSKRRSAALAESIHLLALSRCVRKNGLPSLLSSAGAVLNNQQRKWRTIFGV